MADNYLITGYHGEPHVTVENERGFNAAVFGAGKFVLPVGRAFQAERVGSNTIRMYDGKLLDNGALAGIPTGEYIDFTIQEAGRSRYRLDVIVFEYSRNGSTLVESGVFKVISGAETTGEPIFPTLTESDLLTNMASFDQMPLWVIPVSGSNISDPYPIFDLAQNLATIYGDFIGSYEKGATNGVATLDSSGKVPSSQLPSMNYIPTSQKGAVSGVASLDSSGKVPSSQLPSMDYIPTIQKGAASGVAPLNASKKIDSTYLPSMNFVPIGQKVPISAFEGGFPIGSNRNSFYYKIDRLVYVHIDITKDPASTAGGSGLVVINNLPKPDTGGNVSGTVCVYNNANAVNGYCGGVPVYNGSATVTVQYDQNSTVVVADFVYLST